VRPKGQAPMPADSTDATLAGELFTDADWLLHLSHPDHMECTG